MKISLMIDCVDTEGRMGVCKIEDVDVEWEACSVENMPTMAEFKPRACARFSMCMPGGDCLYWSYYGWDKE